MGSDICKQAGLLRSPSGRQCWWDGGTLQPRGTPGAVAMLCPDVPAQGSGSKDASRGVQRLHSTSSETPQQLAPQCSAAHWHQQRFLSEVFGKGLDYPEERAVWAPSRTALLQHIPHLHPCPAESATSVFWHKVHWTLPPYKQVIFIAMTDVYKAGFKNSLFIQLLIEQRVTTSFLTMLQNQE